MTTFLSSAAVAQDRGIWIQIEAQPTVAQVQERAQTYTQSLPDVNGFDIGSGWFGIALGPYTQSEAAEVLRQLRANRAIPADSFIVDGAQFQQQVWPTNGTALTQPVVPVVPQDPIAPQTSEPEVVELPPEPVIIPADETPAEAQAAEAALTRDEKRDLQTALQWAGFYTSTIDGLFGRGTRNSMAAWQEANTFEVTGVLTTNQRAELFRQYNAILDGMDMRLVRDRRAGIEMEMPTGVVSFSQNSPPFARYDATGDVPAQVLLISQPGNQDRLFGLYEIMQTLEIIPEDGPRERNSNSFTIEGSNANIHSYTFAQLDGGEIKGFTLVWPAGDEERRTRVLDLMRSSFARTEGVLDPGLVEPGEEQSIDLVSGLAIRQPIRSRSGFYIDDAGTVLTTLEAVGNCGEVILDAAHTATIVHTDANLGLAVLQPTTAVAPRATASFQSRVPRLQSQVAVAGYPYGGLLSAPSLAFGTLADIRGLNGETDVKRLSISAQDGDSGGPVFDNGGAVIGMLLPDDAGGRVLPGDVSFSLDVPAITASLESAGITYDATDSFASMTPERLTRMAADVTVLVSCWE